MESAELTDDQEIVLITVQMVSALLSLIGSATIVFKIVRSMLLREQRATTPYDRIVLGLSGCDILGSLTHAVGPFLLPSETSLRVWAIGTERTCEVVGLFNQTAIMGAMWYNCLLSFYYLLTVRFRVRREDFQNRYERWMHLSALFFPITGILGYAFRWYAEQGLAMTCYVEYPIVAYVFGGVPMAITFLSIVVNNIVIYAFVKKTLLSDDSELPPASRRGFRPATEDDTEDVRPQTRPRNVSEDLVVLTSHQRCLRKEAATQGFFYVASFYLTGLPVFVIQILGVFYDRDDQGKIYWLLLMNSLLLPLQGFFNVFIYVRPTYTRFHAADPTEPTLKVLKKALFDLNIPKLVPPSMIPNDPSSNKSRKERQRQRNQQLEQQEERCPRDTEGRSVSNFVLSDLDNIAECEEVGSISPSFRDQESGNIALSFREEESGNVSLSFLEEESAFEDKPGPIDISNRTIE